MLRFVRYQGKRYAWTLFCLHHMLSLNIVLCDFTFSFKQKETRTYHSVSNTLVSTCSIKNYIILDLILFSFKSIYDSIDCYIYIYIHISIYICIHLENDVALCCVCLPFFVSCSIFLHTHKACIHTYAYILSNWNEIGDMT